MLLGDGSWQPPDDFSAVWKAAMEGGMKPSDTSRLLDAIKDAAGEERGAYIVTITDLAMVDLAQNMLRSLDAVPSRARRLVVGMGSGVCGAFDAFRLTTCVEVFQGSSRSEDEVAWGTHEYWKVVFWKHAVLTVVGMSNMSENVIYSDPDIVYLDSPVGYLFNQGQHNDITFSPNNMLEPDASSLDDLAAMYEKQGMENITLGPHGRRADINTGLFHLRSSDTVSKLMLKTLRIMKDNEFVHGHFQQYALVQALAEVPASKIGVAAGDVLVNGNVFWGHRELLSPDRVVSVHANWMAWDMKRECLSKAGLWIDGPGKVSERLSFDRSRSKARLDERGATVMECWA